MTRTLGTTRYAPTPTRNSHDVGGGYRIVEFGVRLDVDPRSLCASPEYAGRVDQLWFDDSIGGGGRAQAMAICFRCPIRQACYDYAFETKQAYGVWGGVEIGRERRLRTEQFREISHQLKQQKRKVAADG
jgi:WhiB family redox-sensing transcriptional regulator